MKKRIFFIVSDYMFSDSKFFIIIIFFFKFSFYNLKIFFEAVFKIFIFYFSIYFLFYKILNPNSKTLPLNSKP